MNKTLEMSSLWLGFLMSSYFAVTCSLAEQCLTSLENRNYSEKN